jgi:hypothetical protein
MLAHPSCLLQRPPRWIDFVMRGPTTDTRQQNITLFATGEAYLMWSINTQTLWTGKWSCNCFKSYPIRTVTVSLQARHARSDFSSYIIGFSWQILLSALNTRVSLSQHWRFIWGNKHNTSVPLQETPPNKIRAGGRRHTGHAYTRIVDVPAIGYTQMGGSWPSNEHRGGTRAQQWYHRTSSVAAVSTQYTCEEPSLREYSIYSWGLP